MRLGDRMTTPARAKSGAVRGPRLIGRSGDLSFTHAAFYAWRIAKAVLREIFDENRYERFLLRTNAVRSVASYRAFLREREAAMVRGPRCC